MLDFTNDTVDILLQLVTAGSGGSAPTGEIAITENGDYDVASYAEAHVDVGADNSLLYALEGGEAYAGNVDLSGATFTRLRDGAFMDLPNLTGKVILPDTCTEIGTEAFMGARVSDIEGLENVEVIDNFAFAAKAEGQSYIAPPKKVYNFPKAQRVMGTSFRYNMDIEEFIAGDLTTTVGNSSFLGCVNLKKIELTNNPEYTINFPLNSMGIISGCTGLEKIILHNVMTSFSANLTSATQTLPGMRYIDCDQVTSILRPFRYNTTLTIAVFRKEGALPTISDIQAFGASDTDPNNCSPIQAGHGKVLIPRALLEAAQTATNWSQLSASGTLAAIEDWTVDGTLTGEMNWEMIDGWIEYVKENFH